MAAIVFQTNKYTGITYAYESVYYWDKEKQQSRVKRKLIGKVDQETGKIVPTRKYVKESEVWKKQGTRSTTTDQFGVGIWRIIDASRVLSLITGKYS